MVTFRIYLHPISIAVLAAPLILGALLGIVPWWSVAVEIVTLAVVSAQALTPLGLLNFLVLQWFGARLVRRYRKVLVDSKVTALFVITPTDFSVESTGRTEERPDGYRFARWIWPLTGWWTDYRWIARRS